MDIKVNNVQQAMPVEQTAQLQETDGTFKFTLVSRIEEQELQNALANMMEEITRQGPETGGGGHRRGLLPAGPPGRLRPDDPEPQLL